MYMLFYPKLWAVWYGGTCCRLANSGSYFFYAYFKVEEVRKVVDSELGFVADVPYRGSGAKVGVFIMFFS